MSINDDPLYKEVVARVARETKSSRDLGGVNEELASLFSGILREMHGERKHDDQDLLDQIERVKSVLLTVTGETPITSRVPGGTVIHRIIRKLTRRQVGGLAAQVQSLFIVQQQILETLVDREIVQQQRETRLARILSQHVLDRLAHLEFLENRLLVLETQLNSASQR